MFTYRCSLQTLGKIPIFETYLWLVYQSIGQFKYLNPLDPKTHGKMKVLNPQYNP